MKKYAFCLIVISSLVLTGCNSLLRNMNHSPAPEQLAVTGITADGRAAPANVGAEAVACAYQCSDLLADMKLQLQLLLTSNAPSAIAPTAITSTSVAPKKRKMATTGIMAEQMMYTNDNVALGSVGGLLSSSFFVLEKASERLCSCFSGDEKAVVEVKELYTKLLKSTDFAKVLSEMCQEPKSIAASKLMERLGFNFRADAAANLVVSDTFSRMFDLICKNNFCGSVTEENVCDKGFYTKLLDESGLYNAWSTLAEHGKVAVAIQSLIDKKLCECKDIPQVDFSAFNKNFFNLLDEDQRNQLADACKADNIDAMKGLLYDIFQGQEKVLSELRPENWFMFCPGYALCAVVSPKAPVAEQPVSAVIAMPKQMDKKILLKVAEPALSDDEAVLEVK